MDVPPRDLRRELERALGRVVTNDEIGSVHHLNQFPRSVLREAAGLSTLLRRDFLRLLAASDSRSEIKLFDDAVFGRGVDPTTWRRGGMVVPWLEVAQLLPMTVAEILSPLARKDDEPWRRLPVSGAWRVYDRWIGAPALVRDHLDYRSIAPKCTMRMLPPLGALEPIDDIVIATRRWIALRICYATRPRHIDLASTTGDEVCALVGVARAMSDDGACAFDALLREARDPVLTRSDAPPGFRGPDEWYAQP